MIIRFQANGGSSRGVGLYYLLDKSADQSLDKQLKPKTDERGWLSDTRNCLSVDPDRALEEMWCTAEDQAYLKMQAGAAFAVATAVSSRPPGHRGRSPVPGSHRTWRADFPHHALRQLVHSTACACSSR